MRRLIINADDFGRSDSINQAVVRAHRDGVLTTASLMVNEPFCEDAIRLARENPRLGVGLHLALVCGRSALPGSQIPKLADADQHFSENPVAAGMRFYFDGEIREQLRSEIAEQFKKFRATGLVLDHVNGHLNFHLHPTVFRLLMENAEEWGIRRFRLTCDPLRLNAHLASGNWNYRLTHWLIYRWLSARARPVLRAKKILHTAAVFGLLQNGRVDEAYISRLLENLPKGNFELYSHPSLGECQHEFEALVSTRIKFIVTQRGIELIRYSDLSGNE